MQISQSTQSQASLDLLNCNMTNSYSPPSNQQNEEYESDEERFGEEFMDDTVFEQLDNNHCLYRYVPDEGYNPHSMEEDGTYPEELTWTYKDLPEEGLHEDRYCYC